MRNEFSVLPESNKQKTVILGFILLICIANAVVPSFPYVASATTQILTFVTGAWVLYWVLLILAPKKWEE